MKPVLVLGIGNPSRGDDALGPAFVDALAARLGETGEVELATDFQLQVEHALELEGRARVLFVDASASAPPPCTLRPVAPEDDRSVSSHALSPAALLGAARRLLPAVPPAWVLAIRGEGFALGAPLSGAGRTHLDAALLVAESWLTPDATRRGWRFALEGVVQGVGLRAWARARAQALGLDGRVANTGSGLVIDVTGPDPGRLALLAALQSDLPPGAALDSVGITAIPPAAPGFTVAPSDAGEPRLALAPDTGVCPACLADVAAAGRHHGYPLTSCARCGPRYAVATALPWDRARTTLADWPLCAACAAAVADPDDRRFHAQGVGCARCGPPVWLLGSDGEPWDDAPPPRAPHAPDTPPRAADTAAPGAPDAPPRAADTAAPGAPAGPEGAPPDPVAALAEALLDGAIAAVQGVGAFHLVCDATNPAAVAELRRRKRRETRPFAVMVADLPAAHTLAALDPDAEAALTSPARPIVLAPARGAPLAGVHPGTHRVGLLLPYTALHAALLARVGRPLVVTSANRSGEPAVIDTPTALRTLAGVAELFCVHGRAIARRVEDSVVATGPLGPRLVRRARGYVPRAIPLARAAPEPVLAVGGHLKATATVVVGDRAFVGPHLGDLDTADAEDRFAEEVEGLERLLGVRCRVVAHDLHPDYASTRYARARGGTLVGVQHHAAHVYAALAEHRLEEPVVALALDGTGWGPDGTSWGTELLLVDGARWQRLASARPLPLPGGDRAAREPWRAALAALWLAYGDDAAALAARLPLFATVPEPERAGVLRMLATGTNTPGARGLGRWFDAAAALVLARPRAGHEAELPVALEELAAGSPAPYPVAAPGALALEATPDAPLSAAHALDPVPAIRALVDDLLAGAPGPAVAAAWHDGWARALAATAAGALGATGLGRVVLTGGATQNDRLTAALVRRLGDTLVLPRALPANDGGISLGQAWAAILTGGSEA